MFDSNKLYEITIDFNFIVLGLYYFTEKINLYYIKIDSSSNYQSNVNCILNNSQVNNIVYSMVITWEVYLNL